MRCWRWLTSARMRIPEGRLEGAAAPLQYACVSVGVGVGVQRGGRVGGSGDFRFEFRLHSGFGGMRWGWAAGRNFNVMGWVLRTQKWVRPGVCAGRVCSGSVKGNGFKPFRKGRRSDWAPQGGQGLSRQREAWEKERDWLGLSTPAVGGRALRGSNVRLYPEGTTDTD